MSTRHRPRPSRISALLVAGALAVPLLAACGSNSGSGSGSSGPTTITFSYLWGGPEGQALEKVISEFNASQSAIRVKGVSNPDFQKQLASMSSRQGSFDISDNFGSSVGSWASKGILAPLDDYLGGDTGDFLPAAMGQMRYQGKTYALPIAVHDFQLLYNKKLLGAAGISKPPATTDELAADVAKLTTTDSSGAITRLGLGNPDTATTLTTLGYAFGGTWDAANGTSPTPSNPGNVAALTWWQNTITNKYGADKIAKFKAGWGQYMSPQDPFYTGKVAMVIDGEWQAVAAQKSAPNLDWGVAPLPVARPDLAGATQLTASMLFIPANSQHKKEAATFLKYLTGAQAMKEFTLALGNLPARTSLLADPAYNAIPKFDAWLNALRSPNVKALSSAPYGQQYATDLASAFDAVTRGTTSPAKALDDVAAKATSYAK